MGTMTFEEALEHFVSSAQAMIDAHYARNFPGQGAKLTTSRGKRYVRVISSSTGLSSSRSVYCFVDTTNGDVLKAASWKTPAKGARGSIYASDATSGVTPNGAKYRYMYPRI